MYQMMSAVVCNREATQLSSFPQPTYASWKSQMHGNVKRFDGSHVYRHRKSNFISPTCGDSQWSKPFLGKSSSSVSPRFRSAPMPSRAERRELFINSSHRMSLPVWPSNHINKSKEVCVTQPNSVNAVTSSSIKTTNAAAEQKTMKYYNMTDAKNNDEQPYDTAARYFTKEKDFIDHRVRIKSYNVMRDFVPFHASEDLVWSKREQKILNVISTANADILCLQECIDLPNFPIVNFLVKLKLIGYDYMEFYDRSGINNKILRVVTAWRRGMFTRVTEKTMWLSPDESNPTPAYTWAQRVARPVGLLCLKNKNTNTCFWIANTHLGHSLRERVNSMKLLPWLLEKHTKDIMCKNTDDSVQQQQQQQQFATHPRWRF